MNASQLKPQIHPEVYVARGVWIMGDVRLARKANIWYGGVLRGDINYIEVGEGTNIQDGCVLHVTHDDPCVVGSDVTVGHKVILHACKVEDQCLIGMGAIILNQAVIGEKSVVAAGSLVTEGTVIPPGSMVMGLPAKVVRPLTEEEKQWGSNGAKQYQQYAIEHQQGKYTLHPSSPIPE